MHEGRLIQGKVLFKQRHATKRIFEEQVITTVLLKRPLTFKQV